MLADLWNGGSHQHRRSRAVTPENPTGAKGHAALATEGTGAAPARALGPGWKISPSIVVGPGSVVELANINGPGIIKHIWLTTTAHGREAVLRMYWDGGDVPAVEVPLGDFFCNGWASFSPVASLPIVVAPHRGMNSYWQMPFKSKARLTLENLSAQDLTLYYQVDYSEQEVAEDAGYFHAWWQSDNPVVLNPLVLLNNPGQYTVALYTYIGEAGQTLWGQLLAFGLLACVPPLIVIILAERRIVRGLVAGAVK